MRNIKNVLSEALGFFGVLIYQLLNIISAVLPSWVVSNHYIKSTLVCVLILIVFYVLSMIFPVAGGTAGLIIWVWGMVIVIITGPLWFTIVYAVLFVISMLKFISGLFGKE